MAEGEVRHGAACNNKGRVLAAFTLVRWHDSWYLCLSAGLGAVLLATLKKYLPFYKCTMQLSSQQLYALAGACAQRALTAMSSSDNLSAGTFVGSAVEGSVVVGTAGDWVCPLDPRPSRALWLTSRPAAEIQSVLQPVAEGELEEWEALGMLAGHYPFRVTDAEQFTPQELQFDRNGYVSFSKGCYTGQEIVARMHYRGKLKKQLYLLTLDNPHLARADDAPLILRDAAGMELGHSLVSRALDEKIIALASLPVQFADAAPDLFTAEGQPVQHIPFPTP